MVERAGWDSAINVLCVRLDSTGDVLMTTPAIRALKESHPRRRVTLLTSSTGALAAQLVPEIDRVLIYEAPWMKATAANKDVAAEYDLLEALRENAYDAAVIFTVYSQNPLPAALMCYLAGIPLRLAHCHENPYQLLTHWVPDPEPAQGIRHEVQRQLDLVSSVGCIPGDEHLSVRVPEDARAVVLRHLKRVGVQTGAPWVVIHPGATAPSRRYPPEGFTEVARRLVMDLEQQVVFVGVDSETSLVEDIRGAMNAPSASLVGKISLGELAALLEMAPLLVANNSGPVHLAAAVGTPVVDLYALTNPQHTPWMVPNRTLFQDVPCKYCYKSICPEGHHHCLRLVTPEQVVEAVRELLAERMEVGVAEAL